MISIEYVIGWFVVYTLVSVGISKKYGDEDNNWNIWGPLLKLRSNIGVTFANKIANVSKRFWRLWGNIGSILAIITGVLSFLMISISLYGIINSPNQVGIQGPTDMIVIPGVNRFLPLSATPEIILALLIAMVVHEGGHAIYCVLGDINIESTGVIFAGLLPMGAFVEPDEDEQNKADTRDQVRMYSAGIMNNYATFVISIILIFTLIPILINPITGIGIGSVYEDSPASEAGIQSGSVITELNGEKIEDPEQIQNITGDKGVVNVTTHNGKSYDIPNGSFILRSPEITGLEVGNTIVSVEDRDVRSSQQLSNILSNYSSDMVEITYKNGNKTDIKVGVYVTVQEDSGIADSMNLGIGNSTIISSISGDKVNTENQFRNQLNNSGDKNITYWNSENELVTTTIDDSNTDSLIISDRTSGIQATDLGVRLYPKDQFYNTFNIDGGISNTLSKVYTAMILPISSIIPGVAFGFPGFTPFVQNFYTVTIGGSLVSSIVFFLLSVSFWTAWINVNLAIFNCLPTFALDGGHILKAGVWSLPFDITERREKYIIGTLKLVALIPLIGLLIGPLYF